MGKRIPTKILPWVELRNAYSGQVILGRCMKFANRVSGPYEGPDIKRVDPPSFIDEVIEDRLRQRDERRRQRDERKQKD